MDGRKNLLRRLLIATLACSSVTGPLLADDFIRPPSKPKPQASSAATTAPIKQPTSSSTTRAGANDPAVQTAPASLASPEASPFTVPSVGQSPLPPVTNAPTLTSQSVQQPRIPSSSNATTQGSRSRIPSSFASRPAGAPVPSRTASQTYSSSSSQLNWQPRNGRSSGNPASIQDPRPAPPSSDTNSSVFGSAPIAHEQRRPGEVQLVEEPWTDTQPIDQDKLERQQLAQRISQQLTSPPTSSGATAAPLEPGAGWQAIGEQLKSHVARCEELLSRRAYLSAVDEANQAILNLARALDLRDNKPVSEPAWIAAQQSFRESQDFTRLERMANDSQLLAQLIQSHETNVLHGVSVQELTPLAAAQHYRAHAESCLVAVAQGHPWFAELYYCLGRALQAQAESKTANADTLVLQSLSYYRAASAIDPGNATNANQLAYVLLRLDRPTEAFSQLQQTVTLPGCPLEAWQNLVQASSRLGDKQTEKWAMDQYTTLKMQGTQPSGPVNTLLQVTPEQFMAMSPRTVGPSLPMQVPAGAQYVGGNSPMSVQPIAPAPPAQAPDRTANNPILGIFR